MLRFVWVTLRPPNVPAFPRPTNRQSACRPLPVQARLPSIGPRQRATCLVMEQFHDYPYTMTARPQLSSPLPGF